MSSPLGKYYSFLGISTASLENRLRTYCQDVAERKKYPVSTHVGRGSLHLMARAQKMWSTTAIRVPRDGHAISFRVRKMLPTTTSPRAPRTGTERPPCSASLLAITHTPRLRGPGTYSLCAAHQQVRAHKGSPLGGAEFHPRGGLWHLQGLCW